MLFTSDKFCKKSWFQSWLLWVALVCLGLPAFADQSVTLTWNPSPDSTAVGYKIYYGGASGNYTNTVNVDSSMASTTIGGLSGGATYYFSATTVSSSGTESPFSNEATYAIPQADTNSAGTNLPPLNPPVNQPATLDAIANLTIYQNAGLQTVNLTGISAGTGGNATATISVVSSDPTIVSTPAITYDGSSSTAAMYFVPVANALGTTTITVTVDNGSAQTSQAFTVSVVTVPTVNPNMPTVDAISDLTIYQDAGVQTVPLTGIAAGAVAGGTVAIWGYTSDATVVPAPTVNYASPNSTGTLTFAPAGLGTSTMTVKVNNGVNNYSQIFNVTVVADPNVNQPPTLDAISNLNVNQNAGLQTVVLTGITAGSAVENQTLTVSAVSSNPSLISTPSVDYSSPNNFANLTFVPVPNAVGTATITVTVNDGGANVVRTFTVKVAPLGNQAPTLNPITDVSVLQGTLSLNVPLTGISSGLPTEKQTLRVSATTSNSRIVSTTVRYSSPGSTGVLTLRPVLTGSGTAVITVTVNDGSRSNNIVRQSFSVTVVPNQPPTLDPVDNITMVKGSAPQIINLTGISSGSPTENQVLKVTVTSSNVRVVPVPKVQYSSPSDTAVLTIRPAANFIGVATVTVTVNDGARNNNVIRQRFTVTVTPPPPTNVVAAVTAAPKVAAPSAPMMPNIAVQGDVAASLTSPVQTEGVFSFLVTGVPGAKYAVQATSDWIHWTTIETNASPFTFEDNTDGADHKFYRAVYVESN